MYKKNMLLLNPHLSIHKRGSIILSVMLLCVAAAQHQRWLLVTSDSCIKIDSDLCEVDRWTARSEVREAAVEPSGALAAIWVEDGPLFLLQTDTMQQREIHVIPEGWDVRNVAVSTTAVAVDCRAQSSCAEIRVWRIEDGAVIRSHKWERTSINANLSLVILPNDGLVYQNGDELCLFTCNWENSRLIYEKAVRANHNYKVKNCPDGKIAGLRGNYIQVFDNNLLQIFDSKAIGLRSLYAFALSDSSLIVFKRNFEDDTELVLLKKCERRKVSFCRIRPSQTEQMIVGATWHPETERFVIYLLDGEYYHKKTEDYNKRFVPVVGSKELVVQTAGDDSEISRFSFQFKIDIGAWYCDEGAFLWHQYLCYRGALLVIWEPQSRCLHLSSLRGRSVKKLHIEEDITAVALNGSRLAIATRRGAILLSSDSEELQPVVTCSFGSIIKDLILFETAVGILLGNDNFQIFDLSGRELKTFERVERAFSSHCGKRMALQLLVCPLNSDRSIALEVSQEGQEINRIEHSSSCFGIKCLPNGLLSWSKDGEAFLATGDEKRRMQFPRMVEQVKVTNDGSLAFLEAGLFGIWIMDLQSGKKELLLEPETLGYGILRSIVLSPCANRILCITTFGIRSEGIKKRKYYILTRRDTNSKS